MQTGSPSRLSVLAQTCRMSTSRITCGIDRWALPCPSFSPCPQYFPLFLACWGYSSQCRSSHLFLRSLSSHPCRSRVSCHRCQARHCDHAEGKHVCLHRLSLSHRPSPASDRDFRNPERGDLRHNDNMASVAWPSPCPCTHLCRLYEPSLQH